MVSESELEMLDEFYEELIIIFDLKVKLKQNDCMERINAALQKYIGLDLKTTEAMDFESIVQRINSLGEFRVARLMITSHLLKELADVYIHKGDPYERRTPLFITSLLLFTRVYQEEPEFDFDRHIMILHELTNRVPHNVITDKIADIVDKIYDSIYQ